MTNQPSSLGKQMAKGAVWLVFLRFCLRAIGLISTIILARLLVPEDFGLVALGTMMVASLALFGQFGFDVVLIQNQEASREHYDTVWTLTIIIQILVATILLAAAVPIAEYFNEPRLRYVLYFLCISEVVKGFANIGIVNFRKDLNFRKEYWFSLTPKIISFIAVISIAFIFRNYWALVIGILINQFARLILSYGMHPYRPRLTVCRWREVMSFSKYLLLNNILLFVYTRFDSFLIGKTIGSTALGLYSVAFEISNMATSEIVAPVRRALFPGYAKLAKDMESLRQGFLDTLALILMIAAPIAIGLGLVADPLVRIFLGTKWLDAIPLLEVLAAYGLITVFSANSWPVYLAMGRPGIMGGVVLSGIGVLIPSAVYLVEIEGTLGVAYAVTLAALTQLLVNSGMVLHLLRLRVSTMLLCIWRTLSAISILAASVLLIRYFWPAREGMFDTALFLLASVGLGIATYFGAHIGFWLLSGRPDGAEKLIWTVVRNRFHGIERRASS